MRSLGIINTVVLVALLLAGCTPQLQQDMSQYSQRISRVLDSELPPPHPISVKPYPSTRHMIVPVTQINMELSDFYSLQQCELGILISERNTVLGKIQQVSQRLIYENKLLSALEACQQKIASTEPQLAQQLHQWHQIKSQEYAQSWANMLQSAEEVKIALGQGNANASLLLMSVESIENFKFLNQLATPQPKLIGRIETQLQQIREQRLPATLWLKQDYLTQHIDALNRLLEKQLPKVACANGKASQQATIIRNVFYLFFIEKIQPMASRLNELHYKMLPVYHFWLQHPLLSSQFKAFIRDHKETKFNDYQETMQHHILLWQTFFKRCHLSPVAPTV
jgi:hypothetical protein